MQFYIRKCGFQLEKVEMDGRVQVARLTLKKRIRRGKREFEPFRTYLRRNR